MFAVLALATTLASPSCPAGDAARTAMLPLGLQYKLLAHKTTPDDFELDAPLDVGRDIVMLRKTLDIAAQAFFRCEAGEDSNPTTLQPKLAAFLHADRSKRAENGATQDGVYGANLQIKIDPVKGLSNSVFVTITFGIECGDDNVLLLFTKENDQWSERLHWYSDKYTKPSDAFGGGFAYTTVPGPRGEPLLAVIHGHPWCTSVHSGFGLDLLRPASASSPQQILDHVNHSFVIDNEFKFTPNKAGLQLRTSLESYDSSIIFHHGILSYQTTSGKLVLLPVALNARDFVDQWLQEPWPIVQIWSDPAALHGLKLRHDAFDYSLHKNTDDLGITFGPVRSCRDAKEHYQVELDPNSSVGNPPNLYAQIRQNPSSFTMLFITADSDPACTGPDLMHKK